MQEDFSDPQVLAAERGDPDPRDQPLTPVERMAVWLWLIQDAYQDEADALLLLNNLMSRICAANPADLTEDDLELQGMLLDVIEYRLPPTLYLADRNR